MYSNYTRQNMCTLRSAQALTKVLARVFVGRHPSVPTLALLVQRIQVPHGNPLALLRGSATQYPQGPLWLTWVPFGILYQGTLPHSLVGSNSSIPHHSTGYQPYSPRTRPCSRRPLGAPGSEVGLKQKLWRPIVGSVCLLLGQ